MDDINFLKNINDKNTETPEGIEFVRNQNRICYLNVFQEYLNARKSQSFSTDHEKGNRAETVADPAVDKRASRLFTKIDGEKVDEKKYLCTKCPFRTHVKRNLKRHLLTHDGVKLFQCEICGKRLCDYRSLKWHMQSQHDDGNVEKEYKCQRCPYAARYKFSLRSHISIRRIRKMLRTFRNTSATSVLLELNINISWWPI